MHRHIINNLNTLNMKKSIKRKSQKQRILEHLQSKRSITPLEALELYGCLSLAQRIQELRDSGYSIDTELETISSGKRFAKYTLTSFRPTLF